MIFKKKDEKPIKLGLMLGMKVCVAKFNVKKDQDEAKVGYIAARRQYSQQCLNQCEECGRYWRYLVKFSDGSTDSYEEDEIYLDYDRRLEDNA